MPGPKGGFKAGGNINPNRFVRLSDEFTVVQCGSGESIFGVSQEGQKAAPISGASAYTAESGDGVGVFTNGMECFLEAGGSFTANQRLRSDANGKGVYAAGGQDYGAIALEDGEDGELVKVQVHIGETA